MATSDEKVSGVERDPGSFRDRESRVLVGSDAVYRLLSERGAEDWNHLASSRLFEDFSVVLEFPTREDPRVQGLLSGKRQGSNSDHEL